MNTRPFKIALAISIATVIVVVTIYTLNFGPLISKETGALGEFGDFFGGTLNPIFAMSGFLALLWSIALQASEFNRASDHLSEQVRLAREEAESARKDRLSQELLEVIKNLDSRLNAILATDISPPGTTPRLTVWHMALEAERLAQSDEFSPSYDRFLDLACDKGSLIESSTRELLHLIDKMREFIFEYSSARQGAYAPIIVYYADKVFHLLHLVNDLGGAKDDTLQFFASVADPHGHQRD
jgi:hypothetical protein